MGTPALTTLGFGPEELDEVAAIVTEALRATQATSATSKAKYTIDAAVAEACRRRCADLLTAHPLYPEVHL
jgi:glycine hydroxymethyltransferase